MERIVHDQLYKFIEESNIRGDEQSWFTSYLTDRTQSVSLENVTSGDSGISMDISYGVPEGSILGPLLFT